MGLIISRFRVKITESEEKKHKKKTTIEILEDIEKEINSLQKNRKENQDRQKQFATSLIIYSILLYILSAIVFFFLYFPDTWPLRLLYSLPLLAFPFLIWGIKKLLHWYFVKRIAGNDLALRDLRERKKQILEDVMETETYKKAKEILEKFDPARFKKLERDEQTSPVSHASTPGISGTALHQRKNVLSQPPTPMPRSAAPIPASRLPAPRMAMSSAGPMTPNPYINTPLRAPRPSMSSTPVPMSAGRGRGGPMVQQQQMMQAQSMPPQMARGYGPPGPPMPRSVLPRDRGMMDKMMDYLVGDGPENRYALICRACHSHNGMALREEFEYMSFRCCYCFVMNPARKQRPLAPRLEFFTPNAKTVTLTKPEESDDEEEYSSGDDDEEVSSDKTKTEVPNSKVGDKEVNKALTLSSAPSASHTPASSKNQHIQSRSKLPVAGGISTSSKTPTASGPKNNVPSSQPPATAPTTSVVDRRGPEELTGDKKLPKNESSATPMQTTETENVSDDMSRVNNTSADVNNISFENNAMTAATTQAEGIVTGQIKEDCDDLGSGDPMKSGDYDDEYEMITAVDGADGGEIVPNSGPDNKDSSPSEMGEEAAGSSARSC